MKKIVLLIFFFSIFHLAIVSVYAQQPYSPNNIPSSALVTPTLSLVTPTPGVAPTSSSPYSPSTSVNVNLSPSIIPTPTSIFTSTSNLGTFFSPIDRLIKGCGHFNQQCCVFKEFKSTDFTINNPFKLADPFDDLTQPVDNLIGTAIGSVLTPVLNKGQNILIHDYELKPLHCFDGRVSDENNEASCFCIKDAVPALVKICANIGNDKEKASCIDCSNRVEVWTGIGCLTTDFSAFIKDKVLGIGLGIAGLMALLCIIYSAFMLQTSQGSPEKIKKAQELLTNCILGLILIIFSIFILRLIGVTILRVPGFS